MTPEALIATGVYDPAAPNASERLELIDHLLARGFTAEAMIERFRLTGGIVAMASLEAWSTPPNLTSARAVAAECGVSLEQVVAVQRALGFEVVDPDALELWDWIHEDVRLFQLGAAMFGEEPVLSLLRVIGASTVRIAQAAASLFGGTFRASGRHPTELQLSQAAELSVGLLESLTGLMAHAIDGHMALSAATIPAVIDSSLDMAVGFVDLVGSTGWALRLSVPDYTTALTRFEDAAWDLASRNQGRVVKLIGDAAMFVAPTSDAACVIATELCRAVGNDPSLPPARGAVGFGRVTARDGDYFGHLVHIVARATKRAEPGNVVVTSAAAESLDVSRWRLHSLGALALRGLDEAVELLTVTDCAHAGPDDCDSDLRELDRI